MQIPETISRNTIAIYVPKSRSTGRQLDAEDLYEWRKHIPNRLTEISLRSIVSNWEDNPILDELILEQDTRLLLDTLPTDLPLALTISKIDDEIFWRRCYCTRWPTKIPTPKPKIEITEKKKRLSKTNSETSYSTKTNDGENSETSERVNLQTEIVPNVNNSNGEQRTWKRCYLEMHMQEAIENLKPEDYNPQEIKSLVELCQNYVKSLNINQMLAPTINMDCLDRVPLKSIISGLSLLTELKICYKQTYAGENFDWHIIKTTTNDIKNLASGLKNCNLTSFSLINSDIDCTKFITLAKSLLKNTNLQNLDFSHCNISDDGIAALAVLIRDSPCLKSVNMTNNSITKIGAETIAFALSYFRNDIRKLYLDLNKLDAEGGNFLASALIRENCNLEVLSLPGCGLTRDNSTLVEVLKFNEKLKVLDLSNNRMGEDIGELILEMLEWNNALEKVDVRLCNLSPSAIFAVRDKINLKCRKFCDHKPPELPDFNEETITEAMNAVFSEVEKEDDLEDFDDVEVDTDERNENEDNIEELDVENKEIT